MDKGKTKGAAAAATETATVVDFSNPVVLLKRRLSKWVDNNKEKKSRNPKTNTRWTLFAHYNIEDIVALSFFPCLLLIEVFFFLCFFFFFWPYILSHFNFI